MKIGVFKPNRLPASITNYYEHIRQGLENNYKCTFLEFDHHGQFSSDMDICWDPRGGRGAPPPWLSRSPAPIVATYHGAVHLALPLIESVGFNPIKIYRGYVERERTTKGWNYFSDKRLHVITVSEYAKKEFSKYFSIDKENIKPIYHGVDPSVFKNTTDDPSNNYLLHISSYQPKKNVRRIIKAYKKINLENKPRLVIISPGINYNESSHEIDIIRDLTKHEDLAIYYRNAIAFIFPSLHETFGLPILEAMSSGCPVITSNNTSCLEIASSAAICVNPRSVFDLSKAISDLLESSDKRKHLRESGLDHVKEFSWDSSVKNHYEFFKDVIKKEFNKYFWDLRYKECPEIGSGPGSRGYSRWYKKNLLTEIIKRNDIHSVIDIGCGDLAIFKGVNFELDRYLGVDISNEIIKFNQLSSLKISRNQNFIVHDIVSHQLRCGEHDMVVCLDVLIHQMKKEDFYKALKNIFSIKTRYYLISYQDKDGAVSTELPEELPDEVTKDEMIFRAIDKKQTELRRADVSWYGRFEEIIKENFQLLNHEKVGLYRGQSVYLLWES